MRSTADLRVMMILCQDWLRARARPCVLTSAATDTRQTRPSSRNLVPHCSTAFGEKREQSLPAFQYCGPVVHRRDNTVLLGDAIHTVKPFFGFGINTALDDIKWLGHCLDSQPSSRAEALKMFSVRTHPRGP